MKNQGIHPAACIVGEPTEMHAVVAHKGIHVFKCRLTGRAAHSSLTPDGCNAIEYAAELVTWIRGLADKLKEDGPHDEHYDVSFTSITTNQIKGGIAGNIIPDSCEFLFECRNLPATQPHHIIEPIKQYVQNSLLLKMKKEFVGASIEIEQVAGVPGFESSKDAMITKLVSALTNETAIRKVSYATEAGLFQQAGAATVICGPGSISQAHRPNEFVLLDQLAQCEQFLRLVTKEISL